MESRLVISYLRWREGYEPCIDNVSRTNELVEEAEQRGEVLGPDRGETTVSVRPEFIKNGYAEYQQVLSQAQNQHNLSGSCPLNQTTPVTKI